jgi:hypothetical protein
VIRVDAFRVVDEAPDVVALAYRPLRVPMETVIEEGLRSIQVEAPSRRPRRRWRRRRHGPYGRIYQEPGGSHLPIGRHSIRTPSGREHRFDGLLVGTRLASLTRYVRERYLFEPDTVLAELGGDSDGLDQRLSASLENAVQREGWENVEPWRRPREAATLPGVRYEVTGTTIAGLHELHHRGATWMAAGGRGQVEIQANVRLSFGEHAVPIRLRVVSSPDDGGEIAWFDGRRVGLASAQEELPGRLMEDLRRGGRAVADVGEQITPLADLEPMFLLRVPTARERARLGGGGDRPAPEVAGRPGVLLPTDACVVLQDDRGRPLPLPLIVRPADAMAVLGRRAGNGAYVPGLDPVHWRDVRLEPGVRWLVGLSPLELGS